MAAKWSRTSLEFPQELAAILGSVDGQMYGLFGPLLSMEVAIV